MEQRSSGGIRRFLPALKLSTYCLGGVTSSRLAFFKAGIRFQRWLKHLDSPAPGIWNAPTQDIRNGDAGTFRRICR